MGLSAVLRAGAREGAPVRARIGQHVRAHTVHDTSGEQDDAQQARRVHHATFQRRETDRRAQG